MPGQTTERAFETYVEEILLTRGGWKSGSNAETVRVDGMVEKVETAVRLPEYCTALITAAVTGGIDCRGEIDVRPSSNTITL